MLTVLSNGKATAKADNNRAVLRMEVTPKKLDGQTRWVLGGPTARQWLPETLHPYSGTDVDHVAFEISIAATVGRPKRAKAAKTRNVKKKRT